MGSYVPSTAAERQRMLESIGCANMEALFGMIPESVPKYPKLGIPAGKSEFDVRRELEALAEKNVAFRSIFRGAGAYSHYIPSIVKQITAKEAFVTAYTPYQAEISQGILQSIFEFQTMICELTGMDSANASVYDGASATAEAAAMCRDRKRMRTLISAACHPDVIATVKTYCWAADCEIQVIPEKDGATDLEALSGLLGEDSACVILSQPNYFGVLEDAEAAAQAAHAAGAKFVLNVNPIAAAILKTPADCGADIAVGEGQPLGLPLAFGGPYLGFMACKAAMTRRLPGRIVGETTDVDGRRAFVLTLQAREQHIRREKASSNICSNQAWCALTASVYLAAMGPEGLMKAARQCMDNAHYLACELGRVPGFERRYARRFFHEFVTECPVDPVLLNEKLAAHGVLGGLPVNSGILWCATEQNTKADIDRLITLIKEAIA
ncbi:MULTISPECIES: aminomethyl-transferring glycine dehydrogenase subunit GcvPA [Anaerotruncus]|uniref:aminomethyl-transferring glycine dehydrogenase subunit GcvPA n=1 Tax=Anaerotruncus TaxID=244127 RepID=UPI000E4B0A84|nr:MULTISPECIES: aminomethyl-transferring glycine dehydrogenase subunit GcvPA [Anaerotruncus]RGX55411.1 aminomethyl-transferring glycine dehydrogenase subunit GcvPA [Anaerotruncus sp. AF02-27]